MVGRRIWLPVSIAVVVFAAGTVLKEGGPLTPLTASPRTYAKGSEHYYLAWIEHGTFGQKGAAARALLNLADKKEYALTRAIWKRPQGVIRDMLLLTLFDIAPTEHAAAVRRLMQSEYRDAEGWIKTDEVFEGESVDFYFDGPGEAALRLLRHGQLSPRGTEILMQYARSFYVEDRRRARGVFDLFEGLPAYDPEPQPKTINELPEVTRRQTDAIETWLRRNIGRARWSPENRRYLLRTQGAQT